MRLSPIITHALTRLPALGFAIASFTARIPAQASDAPAPGEKLFALHVKPLLSEKCLNCHSPDEDKKLKGEFDLSTRESMLAGGESGDPAVVPGKAAESPLHIATTWSDPDLEMPPKEADKLTEAQQWMIRDWINAGAPWPNDNRVAALRLKFAEGLTVATSGGLSAEWSNRRYKKDDLWAYQPVRRPGIPEAATSMNPVDTFIDRHLKSIGLSPAPPAEARVFIRRATFDLTGLPPTPDEVAVFLNDHQNNSERAVVRLIDRLLASPRYGEQYGRHWLDVVRYADSSGFANDFERPNAWRYRDYVIRSFNEDKPYDTFVREQMAGDEIDPDNPELLIATGFLRMGPWEQTGMSVAKITRQQFLDDVTDSVGQTFLAHALQCARCHDHKFDPVPTRDYYAIQAVFATTQFAGRDAPWLESENTTGFDEQDALEKRLHGYEVELKRIREKETAAAKEWYADRGLDYLPRGKALKSGLPEDKIVPARIGLDAHDLGMERICRKNSTRHRWELERYQPIAYSVYNGGTPALKNVSARLLMPADPLAGGDPAQSHILTGGDPFSPGSPVDPGVLSAAAIPNAPAAVIPKSASGRRLALANWITDPANPLTARVMVNRIWAWHFGEPIAGNANNFGSTGKKPTHPELLDWLASEFIRKGWSVKAMHRLIMTSQAYRRATASRHPDPDALDRLDPKRTARAVFNPRRLTAEELRDAMLATSGELNPAAGGIPCRPDINLEAALQPRMIMGTYAPAYQPNPLPAQRNRRSVYTLQIRGLRDPFMEVFNQPSPEKSCERRETSTVTPQVFTLFNSHESQDRALALAHRLAGEGNSRPDTVRRAFEILYARPPSPDESTECLDHWAAMEKSAADHTPPPREFPTQVVRRAKEEITGQPFTFRESLDVYQSYVPDLQAGQVNVQTRALADLCLVLFNSNEFVFVY